MMKIDLSCYQPNNDIFSSDEFEVYKIKKIISQLAEPDRRLILLYAELGSYEKLSAVLKVSKATAFLQVKRVKNLIKEKI